MKLKEKDPNYFAVGEHHLTLAQIIFSAWEKSWKNCVFVCVFISF